jgi:ribosome-associated translation inhibitor RaiA
MLSITFRNLDSSLTVQSLADELLTKLVRAHGEQARCHLVLEDTLGAHAHSDKRFSAHVELSLANMHFQSQSARADAPAAVREAFERVDRQVSRAADKRTTAKRAEHD